MKKEVYFCDLCHQQYDLQDSIKPDGFGGYTNLRNKYPTAVEFSYFAEETTHYDLCLECSMKIARFIREMWWNEGGTDND